MFFNCDKVVVSKPGWYKVDSYYHYSICLLACFYPERYFRCSQCSRTKYIFVSYEYRYQHRIFYSNLQIPAFLVFYKHLEIVNIRDLLLHPWNRGFKIFSSKSFFFLVKKTATANKTASYKYRYRNFFILGQSNIVVDCCYDSWCKSNSSKCGKHI